MIKIYKYLRAKEVGLLFAAIGLITLQVFLELTIPDYMSNILVLLLSSGTISDILVEGGYMVGCALGSLAAAVATAYIMTYIASNFSARLRQMQFEKVETFSLAEVNRFSTSSLTTRSTNDVMQVQMLTMMGGQFLLKAPITALWAIFKIYNKNWQWTLATGIGVFVLLCIIAFVAIFALPQFKKVQGLTDRLSKLQRETLTGIRVVRAYNAEGYQEEKFEKANEEMTKTQLFANRAMQIMQPGMQLIMSMLTLCIYLIGAVLINDAILADKAQLYADMATFTQYAIQVLMAFMMLVVVFIMAPRAMVSAGRILEVLSVQSTVTDGAGVGAIDPLDKGKIEFVNVNFSYPDAEGNCLENINFTANAGETVAFIGATGSGKTTLINLLPRFYDVTGGQVLVNGINVKEYTLKQLNAQIGYISQKSVLFSGTIADNVAYGDMGRDVTKEEILDSLDTAQGLQFVSEKHYGVNSHVAQGGTNYSGGQRQRISIARGVCKKPSIMIFDDTFSALDYKTDRTLRATLKEKTSGVTNIIVAQRVGTIMDADKIIVLDEGKIVGSGTHRELLVSCDVYKEIASSQLSEEELQNA